jgi:hypothetical protein
MPDVAVDACNRTRFMRATLPKQAIAPLMARQADVVLLLCRVLGVFSEANGNGFFSSACLYMRSARPMKRLTPALFSFRLRPRKSLTHRSRFKVRCLIDMTRRTDFIPNVVTGGCSWRRRVGSSDIGRLSQEFRPQLRRRRTRLTTTFEIASSNLRSALRGQLLVGTYCEGAVSFNAGIRVFAVRCHKRPTETARGVPTTIERRAARRNKLRAAWAVNTAARLSTLHHARPGRSSSALDVGLRST